MPKLTNLNIPENYICHLTGSIILEAVAIEDNNVFERIAIEEWLKVNNTNPITGHILNNKELRPVPKLQRQIKEFLQTNNVCTLEEFLTSTGAEREDKNHLDAHLLYAENELLAELNPVTFDEYWKKNLENTTLTLDLNQHVRLGHESDAITITEIVPFEIFAKLQKFVKDDNLSFEKVIFIVFGILLYRYTGQEDIVISHDVNLFQENKLHLLRIFVNYIPSKIHLNPDASFKDLITSVANEVTAANQFLELNTLVEIKKWLEEHEQQNGSSNVVFNNSYYTRNKKPIKLIKDEELDFNYFEKDSNFTLSLTYKKASFDEKFISRLLKNFVVLLNGILDTAHLPIKNLPLIHSDEKQKLLVDLQGSFEQRQQLKTAYQLFEEQAVKTPNAACLLFEDQQLTYDELNKESNKLAHYLKDNGIQIGDRIGIFLNRSFNEIITVLAVLKTGATYVPLDPAYPAERIKYILDDALPKVIITVKDLYNQLSKLSKTNIVLLDEERIKNSISRLPENNPNIQLTYPAIANLLYTSGSTGAPKGVMIQHASITNRVMWEHVPIAQDEIFCHITSLNFIDSLWEIFSPLIRGLPLVIFSKDVVGNLYNFIKQLAKFNVTRLLLPPSLLDKILLLEKELLQSLKVRYWTNSGEAVSREICERFVKTMPDSTYINIYGTTEVWDATVYTCNDYFKTNAPLSRSIPMGKPIPNTKVLILDKNCELVPIGVIGEIFIGGPGVAAGYWNKTEITAERFVTIDDTIYYRTGDLARYLLDGNIEYLGRQDFLIKIRGFRVEPGEIESALLELPFIRECIVHDKIDLQNSKHLVAYWVARDHATIPPQAMGIMKKYLRAKLPHYMVPSYFIGISKIPLTPNGKTDRKNLPVPNWHQSYTAYVAPQTEIEKAISKIWKELLGIETISINEEFFDIGGNSIKALELVGQINKKWNVSLAADTVLTTPTIKALSALIGKNINKLKEEKPIVELKYSSESSPNLFLFHPINGNLICYNQLISALKNADVNIYGFSATCFTDSQFQSYQSVEALVANYLKYIIDLQPNGKYFLLGYSFGGILAVEMALQLKKLAEDRQISLLGLIDTPGYNKFPKKLKSDQDIIQYLKIPVDDNDTAKELNIFRVCQSMQRKYRYSSEVYPNKCYYFLAEERQDIFPEMYHHPWKEAFPQLEIIAMPGNHMTIMSGDSIHVKVAKRIIEQLNGIGIQSFLSSHTKALMPKLKSAVTEFTVDEPQAGEARDTNQNDTLNREIYFKRNQP